MCGICAVVDPSHKLTPLILASMTEKLAHRGPDDKGLEIISANSLGSKHSDPVLVGLGHTRLAILDLSSAGQQPMRRRADGPIIVFNGEIYNFWDLRRELEEKGHNFITNTDTEVILAAYDQWNLEAIPKFTGMFAFAIWDPEKFELLVVRDRLGIKPIYYYTDYRLFACVSELKALFGCSLFNAEINRNALIKYLSLGYIPSPETILNNVYKLPPGHFLRLLPGKEPNIQRYWDPVKHFNVVNALSSRDIEANLKGLLEKSVRYRMISDVPIGALLSGGIDSTLIVSLMNELSANSVNTFTVGFETDRYNEADYAKEISKYLGTDHHELMITRDNLISIVPDIPAIIDEPFADTSTIPTSAIAKFARENVSVVLSGDGGDELFIGYPTYDWMESREKIRKVVPNVFLSMMSRIDTRLPASQISRIVRYLTIDEPTDSHHWVTSYWTTRELKNVLADDEIVAQKDPNYMWMMELLNDKNLLERMAAADLNSYLVDDILTKVDRSSMAYALEVRVPLLDHKIVEFVSSMPIKYKRRNGVSKFLLRKILSSKVPAKFWDRPKMGFSVPIASWLRGPLRDLLYTYTSQDFLKRNNIFAFNVLEKYKRDHVFGKADHSKKLWNILIFQLWYEEYLG